MKFTWDDKKAKANLAKHKMAFEDVVSFDWSSAIITNRSRHEDGEVRFAAIGKLNNRICTIIYTWREKECRIISFRRANKPEEQTYEENT